MTTKLNPKIPVDSQHFHILDIPSC